MKRFAVVSALAAALCACGDDQNLADPMLIAGGGITGGEIAGRVNVYVIDAITDDPVAGADIYVGEPGAEPITGATDSSGLLQIDDDGLKGGTTITVVASGYGTQTWFGANGANVTIPITPDNPGSSVAQATLSGTIEGWDTISDPEADHFILGLVLYSQSPELGDEANNIPQPGGAGGLPGNACIKSVLGSQCAWEANVRTGSVAMFALIVDVDTNGTPEDDSDDETTVIGFAHKTGITVADGVDQSGIMLEQIDVADLTEVMVDAGNPPTGLDETAFLLGLDLGDDGIAQLGFLQDTSAGSIVVPALSGAFASASYQAITFAQESATEDGASSAIIQRGITDLSATIDLGDYLPLPSAISESGGEYSFNPVAGTAFHVAAFEDAGGEVWGVALLDGRTAFTLPAIDPDPLPGGALDLRISAFDGDLDVTDFRIDDFSTSFDRISDNSASIGN